MKDKKLKAIILWYLLSLLVQIGAGISLGFNQVFTVFLSAKFLWPGLKKAK